MTRASFVRQINTDNVDEDMNYISQFTVNLPDENTNKLNPKSSSEHESKKVLDEIRAFIPPDKNLMQSQPMDSFISLQKWECVVLRKTNTTFSARLTDLTKQNPEEEAEFSIEEVSSDDLKLLEPGAIFYWNIGYLDKKSGQRIRESSIRFRRLPAWTEKELKESEAEAQKLDKYFKK